MKITVLCENSVGLNGVSNCSGEWGLSLYIEGIFKNILLDFGQTDLYIKNAEALGIDINNTDIAVLSHHHFDHINGLKFSNFKSKKELLLHNDVTKKIEPELVDKIYHDFNVIKSKTVYKVDKDLYFLGEIPRVTDFEDGYHKDDDMLDDSALVLISSSGLVVISGCSHSGICNICEYAKRVFNHRISTVIGGFHLFKENAEAVEGTIQYFKRIRPDSLYPMHCIDFQTLVKLENELGVNKLSIGDTIDII